MIYTVPNMLTLIRILVVPVVVVGILIGTDFTRWLALAFYILAGVSDFFDGYIARNTGKVTPIGRFMDPVADKILVVSVIVIMIIVGDAKQGLTGINAYAGLIIILREIIVSSLREYLAEIKVSLPVSKLAKWKTALQMVSLGFLILGTDASPYNIPSTIIGTTLLWLSAIFTIVTAYQYLKSSFYHMKNDDRV